MHDLVWSLSVLFRLSWVCSWLHVSERREEPFPGTQPWVENTSSSPALFRRVWDASLMDLFTGHFHLKEHVKSEVTGWAGPGTMHRFWKVSGTVGAPCACACQCQCWCTALTAQDAGDLADTVLPLTLWLLPSRFSHVRLFATPWTVPARLLYPWILQAILEWAAISSSRGSSWPRDKTWVSWGSCTADRFLITWVPWGSFPGGQTVKRLPTMWETWVQSLGQEDLLEKKMGTHSSILAWKILWTEEPGRLQSTGLQRVGHDWTTSLSLSWGSCIAGRFLTLLPAFSLLMSQRYYANSAAKSSGKLISRSHDTRLLPR